MKFGKAPLAEAEGALLGHTTRLPGAVVLKKGHRLGTDDLAALARAGHDEVVCAQLGPDDLDENEAATRLARAAAGPGIRPAAAATGRANLFAAHAGLLVVDRAAVDAANALDEALTLATLPPYARVDEGDMVATVKIIPFGAPSALVDACASRLAGRGEGAALALRPFGRCEAGLVLTRLPGLPEALLDRAAEAQRRRVERLGGRLAHEVRCAHDEDELAAAIATLAAKGGSPLLVLGASAIADRHDVVPAAIERAGGQVQYFGMPVDPGNLLLLGRLGSTPLIGVPGCARSLKPSGFDWVLERVVAGLPLGAAEIAAMGVGGLLVEGPARPQPRLSPTLAPPARPARVGAIVLAAGRSRRMGDNKLLALFEGKPMLAHVVDALAATRASPLVIVTGHEADRVREALAGRDVRFVHNPAHDEGMSTSLRAGLGALGDRVDSVDSVDGALVCLGDMPLVAPAHVEALLDAFEAEGGGAICAPAFERKRGNPVLWPARYFAEMMTLRGDAGARSLLDRYAADVRYVAVADAGVNVDVDTPEALATLRAAGAPLGRR
ncbi:MAG: molybdopterin-binding/glycosyltransferase family 2 protein [Polyangiaceae bacterium]|jgi:molybdenum cofactor cytidylyltransferase|nr:molybdopterin-binding/glycosyltransferase family 2 protein [Polyangiaceae bacterium]